MKKIPLTTGSSKQEGEKVSQKMRERERERERERDQRFTEEIGVLKALGGDKENLQLPVHHVCCLLLSSSITEMQRDSEAGTEGREHFPLGNTASHGTYKECLSEPCCPRPAGPSLAAFNQSYQLPVCIAHLTIYQP